MVAALMCLMLAAVAIAGSIDGKWQAEYEGNRGPRSVVFDLKQEGETLQGTVGFGSREMPIEEGTIDGNKVTFSVTLSFQDRDIQLKYTGSLEEDSLNLVLETRGQTREMVARRLQ